MQPSPSEALHATPHNQPLTLLGGLTVQQFLQQYWHKKPLLVRQAIPHFDGLLSANELAGLACEDEVQSRLVIQTDEAWQLEHGPFAAKRFATLPAHNWSLLVQAVNHHLPEAQALLQRFHFLPYARLDDLMVSYAPEGGGVGPHFDSYDVFLLQGQGQREWRISAQSDLSLQENAPLRLLKQFDTEQTWVLEPGDMLYLPPHIAHWGIARGECMTYSIGFRAPTQQELIHAMLTYLQDQDWGERRYADADLAYSSTPAQISADMVQQVSDMLRDIQLTPERVGQFLASYLSEPKPEVVIDRPAKASSLAKWQATAMRQGLALSLKTQMLYFQTHVYINGEAIVCDAESKAWWMDLANHKQLSAQQLSQLSNPELWQQLYDYYQYGWLVFSQ